MYVRTYTHTQLYVNTNISDGTRTCVLFKCWLTPFQHFKFIHTVIAAYIACACVRVCVHSVACTKCACVGNSRQAEMNFLSLVCFCHKDIHTASLISWTRARFDFGKKLKATSRRTLSGPHSNTHTADYVWTVVLYANQLHGVAFRTPSFYSVRLPCGAEVINFIFIACPISDSLTHPPRLSFIFFSGPFLCYHESFFLRAEPIKPEIKHEN